MIGYLGEMETEFENTLAFLSGVLMGSNHDKNISWKNLAKTPFNTVQTWDKKKEKISWCL